MLAREMVLLAAAHSRSLHFTPFGFWFLENGAVMQCAVQNVREMVEDVQLVGFLGECFKYIFSLIFAQQHDSHFGGVLSGVFYAFACFVFPVGEN